MTHMVYGLRLRGANEPRYIGLTRRGAGYRLSKHHAHAKDRTTPFAAWLNENRGRIEAFPIAKSDDREVCKGAERLAITLCVALGHRLFNTVHLPDAAHPLASS